MKGVSLSLARRLSVWPRRPPFFRYENERRWRVDLLSLPRDSIVDHSSRSIYSTAPTCPFAYLVHPAALLVAGCWMLLVLVEVGGF